MLVIVAVVAFLLVVSGFVLSEVGGDPNIGAGMLMVFGLGMHLLLATVLLVIAVLFRSTELVQLPKR